MKRVLTTTWLLLLGCLAFALDVQNGTEFIVTDPEGEIILGYGTVQDGVLDLQLSASARQVSILVVGTDGAFSVYNGEASTGEMTGITFLDNDTSRDLSEELEASDVRLGITVVDELNSEPDAPDDSALEPGEMTDDLPDTDEVEDDLPGTDDELVDDDDLPSEDDLPDLPDEDDLPDTDDLPDEDDLPAEDDVPLGLDHGLLDLLPEEDGD